PGTEHCGAYWRTRPRGEHTLPGVRAFARASRFGSSRSPPDQPDKAGDKEAERDQADQLGYPWCTEPLRTDALRLAALHERDRGNAHAEQPFAADEAAAEENTPLAIVRGFVLRFRAPFEQAAQQAADEQRRHGGYRQIDTDGERQ